MNIGTVIATDRLDMTATGSQYGPLALASLNVKTMVTPLNAYATLSNIYIMQLQIFREKLPVNLIDTATSIVNLKLKLAHATRVCVKR